MRPIGQISSYKHTYNMLKKLASNTRHVELVYIVLHASWMQKIFQKSGKCLKVVENFTG